MIKTTVDQHLSKALFSLGPAAALFFRTGSVALACRTGVISLCFSGERGVTRDGRDAKKKIVIIIIAIFFRVPPVARDS